jgi:hypothetical protein
MIRGGFGVYSGTTELKDGSIRVLPLRRFLEVLALGDVFA